MEKEKINVMRKVATHIRNYKGKENAQPAGKIIEDLKLDITGVELRSIIFEIRKKRFGICSSAKGYYFPRNKTELQEGIDFLKNKIEKQQITIRNLESLL